MQDQAPPGPEEDFLSSAEIKQLDSTPEAGFIPAFVAHHGSLTDAPKYSIEAAALVALSLAAGDVVSLRNPLDAKKPLHLNLYTLLVAESSVMRKSHVLGMGTRGLPKNQQTGKPYIITLDDASPQAFNLAAGEAGKREAPIFFKVDEAAGLLGAAKRDGHFMKDLDKVLMKAYDHSPIHIRRTRGTSVDVETGAFVTFFAASTPESLAEALGVDDVATGLLPRFIIFALDDASSTDVPSMLERMKLQDSPDFSEADAALEEHLYRIAKSRADAIPDFTNIDTETETESYPKTVIPWTDEALIRFTELDTALTSAGRNEMTPGIAAIYARALWHIAKIAALFRLSRMTSDEGLDTISVELVDILRGTRVVQANILDVRNLYTRLGSNELERTIADIVDQLDRAKGHGLAEARIGNDYKLTARQLLDLRATMKSRELIEPDAVNSSVRWYRHGEVEVAQQIRRVTEECTAKGRVSKSEIDTLSAQTSPLAESAKSSKSYLTQGISRYSGPRPGSQEDRPSISSRSQNE